MSIYEIVERIAKHYGNSTDNLNKISTATLKSERQEDLLKQVLFWINQ